MCLVITVALGQPMPNPLEAQVQSVVDDMTQVGKNAGDQLVHQYEEIIVEPQQQLEEAVEQIEARRESNPECVAAQDEQLALVLDAAHDELHSCGVVAAHTSAEIASDVNQATQQLVYGGYNLGRTYQKCQAYKNTVLKQSCMAKFYIQGSVYLINARYSIKTIKKSTNERIPAVFSDGNACTHQASEEAILAIDEINRSIDACVAKA
ncbi:uncharacterized protein Dwil_GK25093 [Drosophila willistoni]|uniref:Protein TsetseEP domain-containing protein n=1 Tax=Drosophila willistoni TaxID=7260 RepID=B4NCE8_DROWI|nr:uncharacterized protein LOC6648702 [Drosophila willistoni]EDW82507.2 uncharacterized protein Dwil_GK25093 [Drosophila willistoni]